MWIFIESQFFSNNRSIKSFTNKSKISSCGIYLLEQLQSPYIYVYIMQSTFYIWGWETNFMFMLITTKQVILWSILFLTLLVHSEKKDLSTPFLSHQLEIQLPKPFKMQHLAHSRFTTLTFFTFTFFNPNKAGLFEGSFFGSGDQIDFPSFYSSRRTYIHLLDSLLKYVENEKNADIICYKLTSLVFL